LSLGPNTDTLLASLGDPTSPLTTLLGSLRRVRSVTFRSSFSLAAVAQCVACLRVDKLDEVCVCDPRGTLPDEHHHHTHTPPHVHRLSVEQSDEWNNLTKAGALSCMRLAERLRAREAQFVLGGREVKYLPDFGAEYLRCHGYGHLADLQQALDTIWGREDMQGVQKTIQLLFTSPTISHTFDDHTRPLHKFLTWARKLGVSVEWRPLAELPLVEDDDDEPSMRVDCREEVSSASPAVVQQLAQQATKVDLYCGGTPLHESRKSLLTFPNAKTLYIDAPDDTPVQKGLDGIPPFVLETDKEDGNNK